MAKSGKKQNTWTKNEVFAHLKNKGEKERLKKDLIDLAITQKVSRHQKTDEVKDLQEWVKTIRQTTGHSPCALPPNGFDKLDYGKSRCKSAFPRVMTGSRFPSAQNSGRENSFKRQSHDKLHASSIKPRPKSAANGEVLQPNAGSRPLPAWQLFAMDKAAEKETKMNDIDECNDPITFEEIRDIWKRSFIKKNKPSKPCNVTQSKTNSDSIRETLGQSKDASPPSVLKPTDRCEMIPNGIINHEQNTFNISEPVKLDDTEDPVKSSPTQSTGLEDAIVESANESKVSQVDTIKKSKWINLRNKIEEDIFDLRYKSTNAKVQPKVLPKLHNIVKGIIHNKTSQDFLKKFDHEPGEDDVSECESDTSDLDTKEFPDQEKELGKVEQDSAVGNIRSSAAGSDDICVNSDTHLPQGDVINNDASTAAPPNELTGTMSKLTITTTLCNSSSEQTRPRFDKPTTNTTSLVSDINTAEGTNQNLTSSNVLSPDKESAPKSTVLSLALYKNTIPIGARIKRQTNRNDKRTDDDILEVSHNNDGQQTTQKSQNIRPSTPLFFAEKQRKERLAILESGKVDRKTLRARRLAIERPVGLAANRPGHTIKLKTGITKVEIKKELDKLVATNDENKMPVAERERLKVIQSKIRTWLTNLATSNNSGS